MYNEMVDYIESRMEEIRKEADDAKKNGDKVSVKIAIAKMIELILCEIRLNNLEIEETKRKINEIIAERESRRNS